VFSAHLSCYKNGKLKRLVAELSLDKQILKDIAEGNF
jgi:hypothetical protein